MSAWAVSHRANELSSTTVVFVTMMFPAPSEAFAGVEVRALRSAGLDVRVRALRGAHPLSHQLLADWNLADLDVSYNSFFSCLRGLAAMALHPVRALRVLLWLLRETWRSPAALSKATMLLPRMFDILQECETRPPSVLQLFWGHYPAVLARLVRTSLPSVHVSMALGAYDLLSAFRPSVAVANAADSLWTHAECNVAAIRAMGIHNPRLQVLRRGVDLSQVPKDVTHKRRGRVVTVARLEPDKGVDDVLRAFAEARARLPDSGLDLVVIGEGSDRRRLERMAATLGVGSVVHFRGAMRHSGVYEELAQADVLMLLSRNRSERLPNAVKEGIACRCICITTRTPGIEELAAHPSNPLVVDQGDWKAAAGHLIDTQDRSERYGEARELARRFVLRNFDASALISRRVEVWSTQSEHVVSSTLV